MGIKGGIARKLLKERYGTPEPPGSFDVDVLLFVDKYTSEGRRAAREAVTGCKLGGLVLEPQDVEVLSKVRRRCGSMALRWLYGAGTHAHTHALAGLLCTSSVQPLPCSQ